jgi:hypothetical protein
LKDLAAYIFMVKGIVLGCRCKYRTGCTKEGTVLFTQQEAGEDGTLVKEIRGRSIEIGPPEGNERKKCKSRRGHRERLYQVNADSWLFKNIHSVLTTSLFIHWMSPNCPG